MIANRTLNDGSTELKLTRNGCSAVVTFHLILRFSLHEKPEISLREGKPGKNCERKKASDY